MVLGFIKTEAKKIIIDWFITRLKIKVPLNIENHYEGVHGIFELESEISWDLNEGKSFISVFKYINGLKFEKDIKELLKYSFEIILEINYLQTKKLGKP